MGRLFKKKFVSFLKQKLYNSYIVSPKNRGQKFKNCDTLGAGITMHFFSFLEFCFYPNSDAVIENYLILVREVA